MNTAPTMKELFRALHSTYRVYQGRALSTCPADRPRNKYGRPYVLVHFSSDMELVMNHLDPSRREQVKAFIVASRRSADLSPRQERIAELKSKWTGPVHYVNWGQDCDGVRYVNGYTFDSQYDADQKMASDDEWADGPCYWSRATEEEANDARTIPSVDTFAAKMGY